MLIVRLQRTGKKGQAYFRIVVMEHARKTKGKFLELLGSYNPHQKQLDVNRERVEHWLSKGAQISATVNNLMVNHQVWDRPKLQSWKPKKKAPSDELQATSEEEAKPAETTPAPEQSVPAGPVPEAPAPEVAKAQ